MAAIISLLLFLIFLGSAFAGEPVSLERIVVNPHEGADVESMKDAYPMQTISGDELRQENLSSVTDLLQYAAGMDVRTRGSYGMQSDLSLRGSSFEEVAVLIDGVKVMDPQTGHYNLDIPLTQYDIERVEIFKNGASSLYGAGAFAGSVNIVTKKPNKKIVQGEAIVGEHALFGESASLSLPQGPFSGRISFDHAVSKAARPNTDFEYGTASVSLARRFSASEVEGEFGYQKKDFGADSFYSNLFPEEEEHTQTYFWKTGVSAQCPTGDLSGNLFLRKHLDKFILTRNNPVSANYHTTYVYGADAHYSLPLEYGTFFMGTEAGSDEISSSNLGKHARAHGAGSLGFAPEWGKKLHLDTRARLDYYQDWRAQGSYNLGAAYDIIDEKFRLKGSLSRAFRIPSFTELYYSDAANQGNPDLKVQTSDTLSAGAEWKEQNAQVNAGAFLRKGRDLIDWTRVSTSDRWSATNLGKVDFAGLEFSAKIATNVTTRALSIHAMIFSYSYTHADKKAGGFYSKYALDILKHQYMFEVHSSSFGCLLDWQLSYNQRYYGETYFTGSVSASRKINCRHCTVEPFVRIENFTNSKYSEVGGVLQPGRWIKSGLKFQW